MKEFDEKAMNIPMCFITKSQLDFIQQEATKRGVKQSVVVREAIKALLGTQLVRSPNWSIPMSDIMKIEEVARENEISFAEFLKSAIDNYKHNKPTLQKGRADK